MVKAIKSTVNFPIDEKNLSKISLRDEQPPNENIWVIRSPDGKYAVLRNNALALYPFPSWGSVHDISKGYIDVSALKKADPSEIQFHPNHWDDMIKQGVIDDTGKFLFPEPEKEKEES